MKLWVLIAIFIQIVSYNAIKNDLSLHIFEFERGILNASHSKFSDAVFLANYACRSLCPDYVIQPINVSSTNE